MANLYSVIYLDGYYYAVESGSYIRNWKRQSEFSITAVTTRVQWTDRGPGVRSYNMVLLVQDWATNSLPYKQGVTQTFAQQVTNLEASYNKRATKLTFYDPFGNRPYDNVAGANTSVYFVNMVQEIPKYAGNNKVVCTYQIELIDSNDAFV